MDWLYVFSGLFVGFVVGLTGVGGGSLMTPLLVLLFGVAPATAVGTDLIYAAITKAGGVFVHQSHRTIEWRITGFLALGSIPAALITIAVLYFLKLPPGALAKIIGGGLGFALTLTALALLVRPRVNEFRAHAPDRPQRQTDILTVGAGVLLGLLVTISSVGAGALGAVFLLALYPRLRTVNIVGTDIAHAVPLTAVAGLGHLSLGHVDFVLLVNLLAGSLPGIYVGSKLSRHVPETVLRRVLATLLLLVGGKLLWSI